MTIFLELTTNGKLSDKINIAQFASIEEMAIFYRESGADSFEFVQEEI